MSEYVKVKGMSMVRDTRNNSIINQDKIEFDNYINKRKTMLAQKEEINSIKEDVTNLKTSIEQIKDLLIQVIQDKK